MPKVFKHLDWALFGEWLDIFEFGDLWLDMDSLEVIKKNNVPQLNQYKYSKTKMACTIVGALIQSAYLYDLKITENDMLECVDFSHTDDSWMAKYQYGKWRYADLWMRACEKRFEKKFNKKLYYATISWDDPIFIKLLKKGYPIGLTYNGNYQYSKDYQSDNVLDGNKFWTATYHHRTTMVMLDGKVYIIDSAAGNPYNQYEIKDLPWLFQNWVYDPVLYVYTKEANILDNKETSRLVQMRNLCKTVNFNANKLITLTNDELYKNDLREIIAKNESKISDIDGMIKKQEMGII